MARRERSRQWYRPWTQAGFGLLIFEALLLGVVNLVSAGPSGCPGVIGSIATFGPSVSVNGHPARHGSSVCEGDRVVTGANSSAFITLVSGGSIQLDEQTSSHLRRQDERTTLRLLHGRALVDADGARVETDTTSTIVKNGLHAHATLERAAVAVVHGTADVSRPGQIALRQAEELTVSREGSVVMQDLSPEALTRLTSWRTRFFSRGSPAPVALDGIAGGARRPFSVSESDPAELGGGRTAPPALTPTTPSGAGSISPLSPGGGGAGLQPQIAAAGDRRDPSISTTPSAYSEPKPYYSIGIDGNPGPGDGLVALPGADPDTPVVLKTPPAPPIRPVEASSVVNFNPFAYKADTSMTEIYQYPSASTDGSARGRTMPGAAGAVGIGGAPASFSASTPSSSQSAQRLLGSPAAGPASASVPAGAFQNNPLQSNQIQSNQIQSNQVQSNQVQNNQLHNTQFQNKQILNNQLQNKQLKGVR
jgi:hypothetical protein